MMAKRKIHISILIFKKVTFVLSGGLVGIYFNILYVLPFLCPTYVWGFGLIAYLAVSFPVVAYIWDATTLRLVVKLRLFFSGMCVTSIIFALTYFSIDIIYRVPFMLSLIMAGILGLIMVFLKCSKYGCLQ